MSFPYSSDNKRYHTQSYHLFRRFGAKTVKLALDAGLSCPNLDGTKGTAGCIYCAGGSESLHFSGLRGTESLEEQYRAVKSTMTRKWNSGRFVIYLQAHSNTYASLPRLKELYREVLGFEGVVGLSVATRPDCISPPVARYLGELSEETYLTVELGLQSIFDSTLALINRQHTLSDFLFAYELLRENGVNTCVHLINGLPGESRDMMLQTVQTVAKLRPFAIKLHLLQVLRGTPLERMYENGQVPLFTLEEYTRLVCDQLEYIHPETVIERLSGDSDPEILIAPLWSRKKFVVLNEIDKEMRRRDSYQGIRFSEPPRLQGKEMNNLWNR